MQRTLENFDFESGQVLLVDKPYTWSSFSVVNLVKRIIKSKVGHAGTLDPLATGLLVLCTGSMTKSIQSFIDDDKEYEATFCLGATTLSYDREKPVEQTFDVSGITEEAIHQAVKNLTGEIEQIPPVLSAIKMKGEIAYDKARRGDDMVMLPRRVTIKEFEVLKIAMPYVHCRIVCSKGTYIRSLARDLGAALHNGAYLYELRRTRAGKFSLQDAWNLDELAKYLIKNKLLILQHARPSKR